MGPRVRTIRRATSLATTVAVLTGLAVTPAHAAPATTPTTTITPIAAQGVAINLPGYALGEFTLPFGYTQVGVWSPAGQLSYLPDEPGDLGDSASAINVFGDVAGAVQDGNGASHPVLWSRTGAITDLPGGSVYGQASGINDFGVAVGYVNGANLLSSPVRWSADGKKVTTLPVPQGTVFGTADAINDAGTILGNANLKTGNQPLLWCPDGRITDLATPTVDRYGHAYALNLFGTSVGYAVGQKYQTYPVRWSRDGQVTVLSGSQEGQANGINDRGVAVGEVSTGTSIFAVRWSPDGQPMLLNNLPGALGSSAWGINDAGYIVGETETAGYQDDAVEWTPNGQVIDLSALAGQ